MVRADKSDNEPFQSHFEYGRNNLVDPASSDTLAIETKPCMSFLWNCGELITTDEDTHLNNLTPEKLELLAFLYTICKVLCLVGVLSSALSVCRLGIV